MDEDKLPTTGQIRDVFCLGLLHAGPNIDVEASLVLFGRWLIERDRQTAIKAVSDYVSTKEIPKVKIEFTNQPVFDSLIRDAKYEAWGEGYESGVNDIANSSTPKGNSIDPEPNPYRAPGEQTEADHGV